MKIITCKNIGNTCYFNSVLQTLINDELFILTLDPKRSTFCRLLKDLCHEVDLTDNNELLYSSTDVSKIIHVFQKTNTCFTDFVQHDAHECMGAILEMVSNVNMYTGKYKISIQCSQCKTISSHYESFTSIMLSVEENCKLYDLFERHLQQETIKEYQCDCCKTQTTAERKTWIYTLPKRLIIVLKRYSNSSYRCKIDYPNQTLKMKNPVDLHVYEYSLSCVIHHRGGIKKGHYYTNVKINKNWYLIDDDTIYLDEGICFNDPSAYILMYSM